MRVNSLLASLLALIGLSLGLHLIYHIRLLMVLNPAFMICHYPEVVLRKI